MSQLSLSGLELLPIRKRKRIKEIAQAVFSWTEEPHHFLSICFVDDAQMRALNQRWKKKAKTTDVLSFSPHGTDSSVPQMAHILGDIVVCVDQASRQASEFGHTVEEEIGVLLAHGLLHLLGFDHERGPEEENMQMQGEMTILDVIGLRPELSLLGRWDKKASK